MTNIIRKVVKYSLNKPLNIFSFEIRRKQARDVSNNIIPKLYDDPLEALYIMQGGERAAFACSIDQITDFQGLSFNRDKWHPFVAAIEGSRLNYNSFYEILNKFYSEHQPINAEDAVIGFNKCPAVFRKLSPHMYYLLPWISSSFEKIDFNVKFWNEKDSLKHGGKSLHLNFHGFKLHGPVSKELLNLESKRLANVTKSIEGKGYDRSHGDIGVVMLKRNDEYLFSIMGGGHHRTAAMAALGYKWIPARFFQPFFIDIKDVDYWPQVRRGIWKREEAIAYINHLFDFDSSIWAREKGLIEK